MGESKIEQYQNLHKLLLYPTLNKKAKDKISFAFYYIVYSSTTATSTDWIGGRKSAKSSQLSPEFLE